MSRRICILLLAAVAYAQDDGALLRATGEALEEFDVAFDAGRVDRTGAKALAESFARLQEDQHRVNARYIRLFRQAHLDVLRRFYAPGLVDKQEASYRATAPRDDDVRCAVTSVGSDREGLAQAAMEVTSRSRETGRPQTRRVLLQMARSLDRGTWRLLSIHDETPDKEWRERPLGVPPEMEPRNLRPLLPTRASPEKSVAELRDAMERLAAAGHNGRLALQRHFFDILTAFYGADFAAKARQSRPALPVIPATSLEIAPPVQRPGDVRRIRVTVTEAVPGAADGRRSPIAEAAFDLKKGEDGWRVVGELARRHPDQPLQPTPENFALLFLVNG